MHLLPSLWFLVAHFDIYVTASHLPDLITITADHLTLGNMAQALQLLLPWQLLLPPLGHAANFVPIVGLDVTQFSLFSSANNCIYLQTAITLL